MKVLLLLFFGICITAATVSINNSTVPMKPDKALTIALHALDMEKIKLWESYRIIISRPKDKDKWCIWFVAVPEVPGKDYSVFVDSEGKTSILPGR